MIFTAVAILCVGWFVLRYLKVDLWPFVHKDTHLAVRRENGLLREALRDANAELLKHRRLISGLSTGQTEITEAFERALKHK